jgi:hypothetical protein
MHWIDKENLQPDQAAWAKWERLSIPIVFFDDFIQPQHEQSDQANGDAETQQTQKAEQRGSAAVDQPDKP